MDRKRNITNLTTFNTPEEEEDSSHDAKRIKETVDYLSLGLNIFKVLPVPFGNELAFTIEEVKKRIEDAKDNKECCQDLLDRLVCAAETIFMGLKKAPPGYELGQENFRRFKKVLRKIRDWVDRFHDPKKSKDFFKALFADRIAKEIADLKNELDSVVLDMTLHILMTDKHHPIMPDTTEQDRWEFAALLSGANASRTLISRTSINENNVQTDYKNPQKRGSHKHIIRKLYRQEPVAEKYIGQIENEEQQRNFWSQVAIAEYLGDSQYIARFRGVGLRNGVRYIYFDWAERGSLDNYLAGHSNLDWQIKFKLAYQISCALSHCHAKNILHHQVRSHNILLDECLRPLLTNFQQSRSSNAVRSWNIGRDQEILRWTAPEKIEKHGEKEARYTKECDVFSFGMLMYEIASQNPPFHDEWNLTMISEKITQGERPNDTSIQNMPFEYYSIMIQAWQQDPENRPTMSHISKRLYDLYSEAKKRYGPIRINSSEFSYVEGNSLEAQKYREFTFNLEDDNEGYPELDINQAKSLHKQNLFQHAFSIFKDLANKGDVEATFFVGYYYYKGERFTGQPKDPDLALQYLEKAADAGNADAQYQTSIIYYKRYSQTSNRANKKTYLEHYKKYLQMAVEREHVDALFLYGQHCFTGHHGYGVNTELGRKMLMSAHYNNHKEAAKVLQTFEQQAYRANQTKMQTHPNNS